jgi:hypothetical protein
MGMNVTIRQMLKKTEAYYKNLDLSQKIVLKVGLVKVRPEIMQKGIAHEMALPPKKRRSWLKMPLELRQKEISEMLVKQYKLVIEQEKPAIQALKVVGVLAENIIDEAFETGGFGKWDALSPYTIRIKNAKRRRGAVGSAKILIDTGELRNSVTGTVVKK